MLLLCVDYKKHDNKKLPASPRWTVEGRIFFVGGHWPSRATWGDWAGQNGILYKKGLVFRRCPATPSGQTMASLRQVGCFAKSLLEAIFQCPKPLWMLIFCVALEGFATKPTQKTEPYFFFSTENQLIFFQLKNKKPIDRW